MTHDIVLTGCVSNVLAGYLKALAVHRLVAEGGEAGDPGITSYWSGDGSFHLISKLDRPALERFFLEEYAPTPLVTPWNGGSGFYANDQQAGIVAIEGSTHPRFAAYRTAIAACRGLLDELGMQAKPPKDDKPRLLALARARLADEVVAWLDAAYVMADDARYPALLGTGGNDGRLDFANNFMQRLAEMFLAEEGGRRRRTSPAQRLATALFAEPIPGAFESVAVGQFAPGMAGGANMTAGVSADARVNPWDFVLALEGALVFAGAAVRRLEPGARGSASFPFHVRASAVGYGSSADADETSARAELLLPVWSQPATFAELRALFSEGRLDVGDRPAETGLDAAQALASLGVDRGIDRFQRMGLLRRNGLAYLAVHLGTFRVRHVDHVDLLRERPLERFLADVERLVGTGRARPDIVSALRATRAAMFDACTASAGLTGVLAGLGALERAVSRSPAARAGVRPLTGLREEWYAAADDDSPEFRLAAAFASWRPRQAIEPVDVNGRWIDATPTWTGGDPFSNVVAIARKRLLAAPRGTDPLKGAPAITAGVLLELLQGQVDRRRFTDLAFGLSLLPHIPAAIPVGRDVQPPWAISNAYCALRAVTSPRFLAEKGEHPAPKEIAVILARLRARDLTGAVDVAARRLRASRCRLWVDAEALKSRAVTRVSDWDALAAALVLPLPHVLELNLARRAALRPADLEDKDPAQARETEGEPA